MSLEHENSPRDGKSVCTARPSRSPARGVPGQPVARTYWNPWYVKRGSHSSGRSAPRSVYASDWHSAFFTMLSMFDWSMSPVSLSFSA